MLNNLIRKKGSDNYNTPKYAVLPIIKYLKPKSTIWCPFDKVESEYVKVFKEYGFKVINTHIDNEQDFFKVNVPECDYIISNPPFSKKKEIIERLNSINIAWCLLLPITSLEGIKMGELLNGCELLVLNKRINFDKHTTKNINFNSSYFCKGILPEKLIFEKIEREDLE